MTIALKPCPAGHAAELYLTAMQEWSARCQDSACCAGWMLRRAWPTREEAAKAWNTRAEPEVLCKAWAYIGDGKVVADNGFLAPEDAWSIMLGWPTPGEIEEAKARGCEVVRVKIVRAG